MEKKRKKKIPWPIETMKKEDYPFCMSCGKQMEPAVDPINKRVTGYIWKCHKCMPGDMVVCIG